MIELLTKLIGDFFYAVIVCSVLLFVVAVVLPDGCFRWLLHKIKPDLTSKKALLARLRLTFDYLFNNKDVVLIDHASGASNDLQTQMNGLMREKRLLEGNLFFLDLLQNLSKMLVFSVPSAGYGGNAVYDILDQSMNYLRHYAHQLKPTSASDNIKGRVDLAASTFSTAVNDTAAFLRGETGDSKLQIAKDRLHRDAARFDSFMQGEYELTKQALGKTNQLLADRLFTFVGDAT